jgi:hypothetical protein
MAHLQIDRLDERFKLRSTWLMKFFVFANVSIALVNERSNEAGSSHRPKNTSCCDPVKTVKAEVRGGVRIAPSVPLLDRGGNRGGRCGLRIAQLADRARVARNFRERRRSR